MHSLWNQLQNSFKFTPLSKTYIDPCITTKSNIFTALSSFFTNLFSSATHWHLTNKSFQLAGAILADKLILLITLTSIFVWLLAWRGQGSVVIGIMLVLRLLVLDVCAFIHIFFGFLMDLAYQTAQAFLRFVERVVRGVILAVWLAVAVFLFVLMVEQGSRKLERTRAIENETRAKTALLVARAGRANLEFI